jgi:tetratricopeptide (TPR) repeat protein
VRALLEQAARDHPGHPGVVTRLSRLDLAAGRADRALAQLDSAVQTNQATPSVLLERARVHAARGDLAKAQQDALRAFEAQPSLAGASSLVAALYRAQGQEKEAIASFEEALAAGALRPTGRFLLAQLHLAGDPKRSRELLEALVAERSDLAMAKNDLAYILAAQGEDLDRALRLAEEASQGLADSPAVADTLGFVYLQKSLHEPALQQFRRAVVLAQGRDEDQSIYHYHLGLALRALGRTDDAAQAFEKAIALDGNFQDARQALDGLRAGSAEATGNAS